MDKTKAASGIRSLAILQILDAAFLYAIGNVWTMRS